MSLLKPLLMSHSLFWIYCIRNIFPPKSNGMSSRHYLWWRWTWDKRCDLWHLKHSCQPPSYQPIVTTCAHISASPSFHSKEGPIPNPCTEVSVAATRTRSPILTEITGISGLSRVSRLYGLSRVRGGGGGVHCGTPPPPGERVHTQEAQNSAGHPSCICYTACQY